MAQIVLGIGSSHGPMLSTPPEQWHLRVAADRKGTHPFRGKAYSFDELAELRKSEGIAAQITLDVWQARHRACRAAIDTLADVFAETDPDVVVIVGNDQMEVFDASLIPAFCVHWGKSIDNFAPDEEHMARLPPGIAISVEGSAPTIPATYPGHPTLGRHILRGLTEQGFDVASMQSFPADDGHRGSAPHAFGFIYRQIMRDRVPPNVLAMVNTFYPPNQPSIARCYDFGKALLQTIRSWDSAERVAIIASGGLTHFTIDEQLDQAVISSLRKGTIDDLSGYGEEIFQSGTSEIKNWIPVAGAMAELGYPMTLVDYVPCYRSEAGTGNAMGFVYWKPQPN